MRPSEAEEALLKKIGPAFADDIKFSSSAVLTRYGC